MSNTKQFHKLCPSCGNIQYYNTKKSLNRCILKNTVCVKCLPQNNKELSEDIKNKIISLYDKKYSITKINSILKISKKRIKEFLYSKNIIKENKIKIKKEFNKDEIDDILYKYENGMSVNNISLLYDMSITPIKRVLKEYKKLKPPKSDGKKIILTDLQMSEIKRLYLEEFKNTEEISIILGLKKSFINKYLSKTGYRRNKSQALSISRTGYKYSDEIKNKLSVIQQNIAKSGKRKQNGGVCKLFYVNEITCQGTYEKFYIDKLIKDGVETPKNCDSVVTPYGVYYPDFSYDDRFIEIKCDYTYDVLIGKKINRFNKQLDTTQYNKIKWVNENIKSVEILIVDKRNNKITKKEII